MRSLSVSKIARPLAVGVVAIVALVSVALAATVCAGKNRDGTPCKNPVVSGSYCKGHTVPTQSVARCAGKMKDGSPCPNRAKFGSSYCGGTHQ